MAGELYSDAELEAGTKAIEEMRHFIASDGYPSIRIGTAEEEASSVLSAAAPLIAARIADGHGPGRCIQPDLAALREPTGDEPDESGAIMARLEALWREKDWAPRAEVLEEAARAVEQRCGACLTDSDPMIRDQCEYAKAARIVRELGNHTTTREENDHG